jgi:hypothetical protein
LIKLGFNVKLKARIGSCVLELNQNVFERLVSRAFRGLIRSVECIDGRVVVNDVEVDDLGDVIYDLEVFARVLGWNYDNVFNCWIKSSIKFRHIRDTILEIFELGEYSFVDVKDKNVVDVGAYVGDSAIYFALRGARKVIAIEPHPGAYEEMSENIRLNNLENIIEPINAGLASKPGRVCVITLSDIIDNYNIDDNTLLKMDCQGCEYDVILNDYERIKAFKEIIFEYHEDIAGKPYQELLKNCPMIITVF